MPDLPAYLSGRPLPPLLPGLRSDPGFFEMDDQPAGRPMTAATQKPVSLSVQWKRVKSLSVAERLHWLETTEGVEAHFGRNLPIMIGKLCALVERIRREEKPLAAKLFLPLSRPCCCDSCKLKRRWPVYYVVAVSKRQPHEPRSRGIPGWISYECWLESMPSYDEGIPQIPSSRGIVRD